MDTMHIRVKKDAFIAETILMPGDPRRAKLIAETYLEDVVLANDVRAMYGYSGYYRGIPLTVMGSGMGMPSFSVYLNELYSQFGARRIIRVGTCLGSKHVRVGDIILAAGACTSSGINDHIFDGDFAPLANYELLKLAADTAERQNLSAKVGLIVSGDKFYGDYKFKNGLFDRYGVLGLDMETAGLYTLSAKYGGQGLTVLTVSDRSDTPDENFSAEQREQNVLNMVSLALETAYRAQEGGRK